MSNSFGSLFKVTTWGESHGDALGVVIDGCPPNLPLTEQDIQQALTRRHPGQSNLTTQRQEPDTAYIVSGVFNGLTLGTPISIIINNVDEHSHDYQEIAHKFRPSHADYTYQLKYGIRDYRGGGRASARETAARVAAGAIAQKFLTATLGIEILAYVRQIGHLALKDDASHLEHLTREQIEANNVRIPDAALAEEIQALILATRARGDSLGGIIEVRGRHIPPGLGEPVFDKLEADLAKALLSIPACRGFAIGSGFKSASMYGSEHNDLFSVNEQQQITTLTNHSGGVQGGISNGQEIICQAAFKPTATILQEQATVDIHGQPTTLKARGRHDPCVVPRAVPIVEAMFALVLMDHVLRQRAQCGPQTPELTQHT